VVEGRGFDIHSTYWPWQGTQSSQYIEMENKPCNYVSKIIDHGFLLARGVSYTYQYEIPEFKSQTILSRSCSCSSTS
jgi:hypothetical protein